MRTMKTRFPFLLMVMVAALVAASVAALAFADPPTVGAPAPEFTLKTNEGKDASLKDFRGKWVVLYFYPKDFTSGCTLEARNFQRDAEKYDEAERGHTGREHGHCRIAQRFLCERELEL